MTEQEIISLIRSRSLVLKVDYFNRFYELYTELGTQKKAFVQVENEFESMYGLRRYGSYTAFYAALRDHLKGVRKHHIGKLMQ